jgi:hypothetical protein
MTNDEETRAVICAVACDILTDIAPQELPIFPALSDAYFANPSAALRQRKRDVALGFGAEILPVLLSPFVLCVLSQVQGIVTDAVKKVATDALAKGGTIALKGIFKKFARPGQPAILAAAVESQRALIRERIKVLGQDLKLSDETIAKLTEAVVAQLAIPE